MNYTVYTITDNLQGRTVYVGKTQDFERRKKQHLTLSTHTKDWIWALGVENITIEPIAEFGTKKEALEYEDKMIIQYNTIAEGFNKIRSGLISSTDIKQYHKQYHKQYDKQYYEIHKAEKAEYYKQYNETHKAELAEYKKQYHKQYYETNKAELAEYQKQYNETHKAEKAEYYKQYYQKKKADKQLQLDISNTPNGHLIQLTIPF